MNKNIIAYVLIVVGVLVLGGIYLQSRKMNDKETGSIFSSIPKNDSKMDLKSKGKAPEFGGIANWINSEPLTMKELRGKVVLIDFWTYSCINCVRTLLYVTKWYDTYKDQGLVVVGVHTPEFAFEKDTKNVETAIKRHKINYPVAQDNDFATWSLYENRYWPAHYLIDQNGEIVYTHFGEGKYEETENAIRTLLGMNADTAKYTTEQNFGRTPEIYFGLSRLEYLDKTQEKSLQATGNNVAMLKSQEYSEPLKMNTFAVSGEWEFNQESANLIKKGGKIKLRFSADKVFMVAKSLSENKLKILIDGKVVNEVIVKDDDLYQLVDLDTPGEHEMEIQIPDAGFEAFTFTFG
jgi:thiol-disulfide isomerase/thioredoxin